MIPNRILDTILTTTNNSAGIFAMQVYVKGIPQVIAIDDYIPFQDYGSRYTTGRLQRALCKTTREMEPFGQCCLRKSGQKLNGKL